MSKLTVVQSGDKDLIVTRTFDAPRDLVFKAFAEPALVQRWMLGPPGWTMPVCDIDLRVGGRYRYVWRNQEGRDMGMGGVFKEIVAPEKIVATELFDEDWTGGETLTTSVLTEEAGRTILTTTVVYANEAARQGALVTGMADGMEMSYAKLDDLLVTV